MTQGQPKLRDDLVIIRKVRHGEVEYVVKDPFNMEYYRLSEFEHDVLLKCDGEKTVKKLLGELNRGLRDKADKLELEELEEFIASIDKMHLFEKSAAEKNAMILARLREDRKNVLQSKKGSLVYKRIPIIDPNTYFNWLEPKIRFFWTPAFVILSLAMMAGAGVIIAANWEEVSAGIMAIFTFQQDNAWGYVTLWAIVLIIIALHEHAHGLTCKHFGGDVHEMGFLFLFFQPCMYANVSDAWTFADRGKRLWVTAAGGYFEFWLGACFTYIWWLSADGTIVNALCYQAMTVCGFSSVAFNFNPLIKLDGYYILCDMLETHNLKKNSLTHVKATFKEKIFGIKAENEGYTRTEKRAYLIYGFASTIYIVGLLTGIFFLVSGMLIPALYGIGFVISAFIGYKLFGRYVRNTYHFVRDLLAKFRPFMRSPVGRVVTALVVLGIIGFFAMPVVHRIKGKTQLMPAAEATLRPLNGGKIVEVFVAKGDKVIAGQVIARLEDEALSARLQSLRNDRRSTEISLQPYLERGGSPGARESLKKQIRDLDERITQLTKDERSLTLRTPIDGIVITDKLEQRIGAYIGSGAPFCTILDPSVLKAEVEVDERDVSAIRVDHPVALKLRARPLETLISRVTRIEEPDPPKPLPGEPDSPPQYGPSRFIVVVEFANSPDVSEHGELKPGYTGTAEIDVGRRSMVSHMLDVLRKSMKADVLPF